MADLRLVLLLLTCDDPGKGSLSVLGGVSGSGNFLEG